MASHSTLPVGHQWRSSRWFIISCITVALFSANFLHTYIVPILHFMLESRLHVDRSQTQSVASLVLSVHAVVSMIAGPLIGYFADKFENRKYSLLMSLGAEMIGTVVIMIAPSVPIILVGRAIQAVGGSAAWIVGYATLADTVGPSHMGKVLGAIISFFSSGSLFGPMASGLILPSFGYWATWIFAIMVLGIDMMMRVVMVEHKPSRGAHHVTNDSIDKPLPGKQATPANNTTEINERTALLPAPFSETEDQNCAKPQVDTGVAVCVSNSVLQQTPSHENFYMFILTSSRALTALTCHCAMGVILLSLDTTLPLHAHRTFGWDTSQIGLMFLLLQLPSLLFASLIGACRDKFGSRFLACLGFLAAGVSIWFLGAASEIPIFAEHGSQTVSMASLAGIGVARSLISGTGVMEITKLMKDVQEESLHRFGPNSKMSSAYSLTNFTWNTGLLIGPIASSYLVQTLGYYYMNTVLAAMSSAVGILAILFLDKR